VPNDQRPPRTHIARPGALGRAMGSLRTTPRPIGDLCAPRSRRLLGRYTFDVVRVRALWRCYARRLACLGRGGERLVLGAHGVGGPLGELFGGCREVLGVEAAETVVALVADVIDSWSATLHE
jgi:hypothetical protein